MLTFLDDCDHAQLMLRTAQGDSAAFTQLYDSHSTLVFSVALKILGDHEEAQDVLQQVFLKLFNKAALYSATKGKPAAWLAALARNQSLDRLRQLKSTRSLGEKFYHDQSGLENTASHPTHPAPYADEIILLNGALAALRPDEVQVLHLAYFGGLSQTEISQKLAQPLGSIKARIRRALAKLKLSLEDLMEIPPSPPRQLNHHHPATG